MNKKPMYTSYKDACMNNTITHRRENIAHAETDIATPPVTSEQHIIASMHLSSET